MCRLGTIFQEIEVITSGYRNQYSIRNKQLTPNMPYPVSYYAADVVQSLICEEVIISENVKEKIHLYVSALPVRITITFLQAIYDTHNTISKALNEDSRRDLSRDFDDISTPYRDIYLVMLDNIRIYMNKQSWFSSGSSIVQYADEYLKQYGQLERHIAFTYDERNYLYSVLDNLESSMMRDAKESHSSNEPIDLTHDDDDDDDTASTASTATNATQITVVHADEDSDQTMQEDNTDTDDDSDMEDDSDTEDDSDMEDDDITVATDQSDETVLQDDMMDGMDISQIIRNLILEETSEEAWTNINSLQAKHNKNTVT